MPPRRPVAEQLGAESVTLVAHDAIEEILSFARAHNFSKIVVGKPGRFWRSRELFTGSFVGKLAYRSGDIDVFIVHGEAAEAEPRAPAPRAEAKKDWWAYARAAATVLLCSAVAAAMARWFAPSNLVLVYLLGVVMWRRRAGGAVLRFSPRS